MVAVSHRRVKLSYMPTFIPTYRSTTKPTSLEDTHHLQPQRPPHTKPHLGPRGSLAHVSPLSTLQVKRSFISV